MQNSNASNQSQSSEILSPTNNPMGAIKVEKQGSFTESASSPSAHKPANLEIDDKRKFVTSAFEAAVIKVKSSILQNIDNAPSSLSSTTEQDKP